MTKMSNLFRISVCRCAPNVKSLLVVRTAETLQKCTIAGKSVRIGNQGPPRPAPYNYKQKSYGFLNALFDKTTHRFDENSKIITVEGPIAVGKTAFAKSLAEDLGMLHLPAVDLDMHYINDYGYDMRKLDPQLPESCKSYDINNFHCDPNHVNTAAFQFHMYKYKFSQYIDALAHLLSTGQGVVLERSVFSDYVFLEAMTNQKYISKPARSFYYDIHKNTISELIKPHLVIYLDISPPTVLDKIKKRNDPTEAKSKVYSSDYVCDLDRLFKQSFLKEISEDSELLIYDWSNDGEVEVVIEDIERIDFNKNNKNDLKLSGWDIPKEWDWAAARMKYTNKYHLMNYFNVPRFDVPEMVINAEDAKQLDEVWNNAPGMEYSYGFNAKMGDTNLLTKL